MRSTNAAGAMRQSGAEMPIPRSERCLRDICLPNSQLMVPGAEIYLRIPAPLSTDQTNHQSSVKDTDS